jgi:hypothetical protein
MTHEGSIILRPTIFGFFTPFVSNPCGTTSELWVYFDGMIAAFVVDTGTMRCAYGVPFHITQGPPFLGSVGKLSGIFVCG